MTDAVLNEDEEVGSWQWTVGKCMLTWLLQIAYYNQLTDKACLPLHPHQTLPASLNE